MLKMTNIRKVFNEGTVNEKTALDGVSLTVKDGDFVTIIGSNGAGKSTLFNCIGGSFYPDEGSIFLDNQNITYMPEHKKILRWPTCVFQKRNLYFHVSAMRTGKCFVSVFHF